MLWLQDEQPKPWKALKGASKAVSPGRLGRMQAPAGVKKTYQSPLIGKPLRAKVGHIFCLHVSRCKF